MTATRTRLAFVGLVTLTALLCGCNTLTHEKGTGPYGEIELVRDWIGVEAAIGKPPNEHPKRPIQGLECPRSEVSGRRLWGLFAERFETPEAFFADHFVANYCPLAFMERSKYAKNITPDKLPKVERMALETICDRYLLDLIILLKPTYLIGIGKYALKKFQQVVSPDSRYILGSIIHPSPANPQANRNWKEKTQQQLIDLGIWNDA